MLGTLIKIAQEMLNYEANLKNLPVEYIQLNRICWNPRKRGEDLKVHTIRLDTLQIQSEDYKDEEQYRYLFALNTGKQAIGPAWVLDFSKTKKGKSEREVIEGGFKQIQTSLSLLIQDISEETKKEENWLTETLDILKEKKAKIIENLLKQSLSKQTLLTIEYKNKKPGDIIPLRESFTRKLFFGGERAQYSGFSSCAVCGNAATVRPSLPFANFFTVEKRGFSPMGSEWNAWKYAPLCETCTKWLYISQSFLKLHLKSRIAGVGAYILPTLEPGSSKIKGSFVQYLWEFQQRSQDRYLPRVEDLPEEISEEDKEETNDDNSTAFNIMKELVESDEIPPFRSLSLIFHQKAGQKFLFLHTTPDILPKHLKQVHNQLRNTQQVLLHGGLGQLGRSKVKMLSGDFNFLRFAWLWPKGKTEKKRSPGSLKLNPMLLVDAILLQKPPLESIFWSDVDHLLRAEYLKTVSSNSEFGIKYVLSNRVALVWVIWNLLYYSNKGDKIMEMIEQTSGETMKKLPPYFWQRFFEDKRMLDTDTKRALFLTGVLFGRIESLQRKERQLRATGEMPILSRLRGLTISYSEITTQLFAELKYKLRQLSGWTRAAKEIEAAAAEYLSRANILPDTEARFYFSLGWSLDWDTYNLVRQTIGKDKEEEEVEESAEEESK